MKNKTIRYKISGIENKVTFCLDTEAADISSDMSRLLTDKKILLVVDKRINPQVIKNIFKDLSHSDFDIKFLMVDGSKNNKTQKTLFKIINECIRNKFTKKSLILSCGGGVVGDVCALASSLYLRGLIYFHIPTTMTAIVDSCIGGKTGINYKSIINSLGNYYHPKNVFISKNIISTIPQRDYIAGFSEIIKSGCLQDNKIFELLKKNKSRLMRRDFKILSKIIFLTLKTKINFFKNDVYENSKRLNLNFGHTFAHAIEMALPSEKDDIIRHGEAVGIGLLCEIFYCEGKSKNFNLVKSLLLKYRLPTNIKKFTSIKKKNKLLKRIYENIFLDKKRINKFPRAIDIKNFNKPKVIEMKNNHRIMETLETVVF
tara:strand:- start:108 stop:1223 length:1116 start_codon:yes stop_codon:yes gene_type:complete